MRRISAAFLLAVVMFAGCRVPAPGTPGRRLVDCSVDVIKRQSINAIDPVNDIIADGGLTDSEAKSQLINLGIDIGQDVLACVLRDQGTRFAQSADANPADRKSVVAARRAQEYLRDHNVQFADSP